MFARIRGKRESVVEVPDEDDPIRAFATWAVQRAEGVCWVRSTGPLDDLVEALAADLPDLGRSSVCWNGGGELADSAAEWFAFEGPTGSAVVLAMAASPRVATRQVGVLTALSRHDAYVVAGGAVPPRLHRDLKGMTGVPVWQIGGLARLAPGALAA